MCSFWLIVILAGKRLCVQETFTEIFENKGASCLPITFKKITNIYRERKLYFVYNTLESKRESDKAKQRGQMLTLEESG